MNGAYEHTKMSPNHPSPIGHPRRSKGGNLCDFIGLAIILSFCLLASIPLLAGTSGAQALEAAAFGGHPEGSAPPAGSTASQGVILLAQADETLQSFGHGSNEMPEKPTPQPKSTTGPSSISKISDLQGCWSSSKSGTTLWDGKLKYFRHCFDKSGRTKSLTVLLDKKGNKVSECKSTRYAKMVGKGFDLIADSPPCPGWYHSVHSCVLTSPGTVSCTVKGEDGKTSMVMYYNADLKP